MLIITLTPSNISYSPPSQTGAWNTSLLFRFSSSLSATLSTLALSQPPSFLPSLMICHRVVSFGCVFSLTIDLLGRETPCKRHKLVLSLTVTALLSVYHWGLSTVCSEDFHLPVYSCNQNFCSLIHVLDIHRLLTATVETVACTRAHVTVSAH